MKLTLSVNVGQVLPRAGDAGHLGLTAEQALGAHLARHARDFRGERVELVDHHVDRVLQLTDLALDVDRDLLGEISTGDGGRDVRDVAHLGGEVAGHRVDVVGQVTPGAGRARNVCLPAQPALGTDLARHARDFRGEGVQLVDHDVDGVLQLEDLALDLDRDLLGEVALLHGGGDLGDVAHLGREIGGELVDLLCEVLPGAGRTRHARLTTEATFSTDLARHAGDFTGEPVQLIDHAVDRVLQLEDLAANVDRDLLGEVALSDGRGDLGDVADLGREVARHVVDVVGEIFPNPGDTFHLRLAAELAFGADFAGDAGDLASKGVELIDHDVDGVLQFQDLALDIDGDLLRKIAASDRGRHVGDVSHLGGEVARHEVDVVGQVLPDATDPADLGLAAELALGADFAGHARDFRGEAVQLVDHDVDRVLQLEDLAPNVDRDLFREVALGDGGCDVGDVAHLGGQVGGHQVDVVGKVFPDTGRPFDMRLAAKLALGADLAGDAGDLGGEGPQLLDHGVDRAGGPEELALERPAVQLELHRLEEIAFRDRPDDARHARQVLGVALIELDDAVELSRDLAHRTVRGQGHADGEIALSQLTQDGEDELGVLGGDALGVPLLSPLGPRAVGPVGARAGGPALRHAELWAPGLVSLGHWLPVYKRVVPKSNKSWYPR